MHAVTFQNSTQLVLFTMFVKDYFANTANINFLHYPAVLNFKRDLEQSVI